MPLVVGIVELIGYREWTESLGSDREWKIQLTQSRLYAGLQEEAAKQGGFIAPLSFDVMAVIANGMAFEGLEKLYQLAARLSPVPVSITVSTLEKGFPRSTEPGLKLVTDRLDYPVAALHIDLNSFTTRRRSLNPVTVYTEVLKTYVELASRTRNAIPAYLGGDNIAVFTAAEEAEETARKLLEILEPDYKIGVGIGPNARQALKAAAEALHRIRTLRDRNIEIVSLAIP